MILKQALTFSFQILSQPLSLISHFCNSTLNDISRSYALSKHNSYSITPKYIWHTPVRFFGDFLRYIPENNNLISHLLSYTGSWQASKLMKISDKQYTSRDCKLLYYTKASYHPESRYETQVNLLGICTVKTVIARGFTPKISVSHINMIPPILHSHSPMTILATLLARIFSILRNLSNSSKVVVFMGNSLVGMKAWLLEW